jgi:hypothetical protein
LNENAQKIGIEDRVEWFEDGRRIWIRNFIKVQFGVLSEKSSTHRGVLRVIESHRHTKGLPKGYQTLIGVVKVKNKVKVKSLVVSKEIKEPNIPFEYFWNTYDKKTDRQPCEKIWNKLSDEDRKAIMDYIPRYKISQPHKQYRKNPQTFLNNKSWLDEIIQREEKQQSNEDTDTSGIYRLKVLS